MDDRIFDVEETHDVELEVLRKIEPGLSDPKVRSLISEFNVIPPSEKTLKRVREIWESGLCLTKSMSIDAAEYLFSQGLLKPASEIKGSGGGFSQIFFSVAFNKGYGPIAVSLKPEVIRSDRTTAAIIDHASTYMTHQMKVGTKEEEDKIMERYRLNHDQFKTLFTFYLASFVDNPPESTYSWKHQEEKLRFITFDVFMQKLNLDDVEMIFIKNPSLDEAVSKDIAAKAVGTGVSVATVTAQTGTYANELAISDYLAERCGLNELEKGALQHIA